MTDTVNAQITDAVTQTNVKVLGEGPAEAVAIAVQAVAHATSCSGSSPSAATICCVMVPRIAITDRCG